MMRKETILARLRDIESDERLWYSPASLFSNSVLAVEQSGLRSRANALRWVLGLPQKAYFDESPESGVGHGKDGAR